MANIPVKVKKRFAESIKKYKPILKKAQKQDLNESDTVTIITDMLSDVFGYDKYVDITSEFAIKKTYCDLAIKIESSIKLLIEAKSIGTKLKDIHLKQATDYGANAGIEWVVLTNGLTWKVYRIIFGKPIDHEMVYEFDISKLQPGSDDDLALLYMLSKEAVSKKSNFLDEYHTQKQLLTGAMIGQIVLSDDVLTIIRRTLKKVSNDTKVSNDEIAATLKNEVIKREILEDDKAEEYAKRITKATTKKQK